MRAMLLLLISFNSYAIPLTGSTVNYVAEKDAIEKQVVDEIIKLSNNEEFEVVDKYHEASYKTLKAKLNHLSISKSRTDISEYLELISEVDLLSGSIDGHIANLKKESEAELDRYKSSFGVLARLVHAFVRSETYKAETKELDSLEARINSLVKIKNNLFGMKVEFLNKRDLYVGNTLLADIYYSYVSYEKYINDNFKKYFVPGDISKMHALAVRSGSLESTSMAIELYVSLAKETHIPKEYRFVFVNTMIKLNLGKTSVEQMQDFYGDLVQSRVKKKDYKLAIQILLLNNLSPEYAENVHKDTHGFWSYNLSKLVTDEVPLIDEMNALAFLLSKTSAFPKEIAPKIYNAYILGHSEAAKFSYKDFPHSKVAMLFEKIQAITKSTTINTGELYISALKNGYLDKNLDEIALLRNGLGQLSRRVSLTQEQMNSFIDTYLFLYNKNRAEISEFIKDQPKGEQVHTDELNFMIAMVNGPVIDTSQLPTLYKKQKHLYSDYDSSNGLSVNPLYSTINDKVVDKGITPDMTLDVEINYEHVFKNLNQDIDVDL